MDMTVREATAEGLRRAGAPEVVIEWSLKESDKMIGVTQGERQLSDVEALSVIEQTIKDFTSMSGMSYRELGKQVVEIQQRAKTRNAKN
jgi:hypothetical protein